MVDDWEFTFTTADIQVLADGTLRVDYTGTITGAPAPFDTGPETTVFLSQSCDELQGGVINCSNTLQTPAPTIPEPASLALLGSALVGLGGLGLFRRRRNTA